MPARKPEADALLLDGKKRCSMCKTILGTHEYHKQPGARDGLASRCKICARKTTQKWRDEHPDYRERAHAQKMARYQDYIQACRKRDRRDAEKRRMAIKLARQRDPKRFAAYQKKYEQANTVKVNCRHATQRAIKNGILIRPAMCPICGQKKPVEAHHLDYSKPLLVEWACRKCHAMIHTKEISL